MKRQAFSLINDTIFVPNSLNLTLGQQESGSDEEWFKGYLHGVNIYSTVLNPDTILHMSRDCTVDYVGVPYFNFNII